MGKTEDDRPAYLSADDAKYSLGVHRGPLPPAGLDDTAKLEQVESAGGLSLATTRTRKERLSRHWKRFWCCYLIGNVIFLAIFLPVFFLVAIPAISQLVVNKSDLVLVKASVLNPQPDSIQLTLQSALNLKIALPVRIDPITLDLFVRDDGADKPWANVTIPSMTVKGNTTLGVEDVYRPLINQDTWVDYVHSVVFNKESTLSLKGTTNSYLGVLKSKVTMDKDVTSPTLDSFKEFALTDSQLIIPAEADGTNLKGSASLPNPSVLTLDIGTLVLDIYSDDLLLGNATLEDVTLRPGANKFPVRAQLDLTTAITHLKELLADQGASLLSNGSLSLKTVTRTVTWKGTRVPYYTKVMSELPLMANVPLLDTLKNTIHGLTGSNGKLNLTGILNANSSSGTGLLSSLKEEFEDNKKEKRDLLAEALKENLHVRNLFGDEHPVKRDLMIDTMAGLYMKA
ncbi:hypothetical protein N7481_012503 [Penicillium waksmanii]|uniref:uncharacterized protein n=1 Tax=Penicillium waksmanii TaxID=69791 RepID=UPI002547E260|nr:uncharacterized protein N7481_012503 [Penicillium waksmanii]KAJ5965789.1 hypothetical protein N7481_012503 [Penicillium waksmanii]